MKKLAFMFVTIALSTSACKLFAQDDEEKFVNPVFYEKMVSIEFPEFETHLTPTHIYIHENTYVSRSYNCNLLTNQKDKIVYECPVYNEAYAKNIKTTFTYTITSCDQEKYCTPKDKWLVTQNMKPYDNYHEDVVYKISSAKDDKQPIKKFANHLFYKTLLPISKISWETTLTPTLQISRRDNKTNTSTCKTLQNTKDVVILKCIYFNALQKSYETHCYKYDIWECNPQKEYCYDMKWKATEKGINCKTLAENGRVGFFVVEEEE